MNARQIIAPIFALCSLVSLGQTKIDKTIPVKAGQKLSLDFDYPEVKIQTWDKNEVLITGVVSINRGENDSAFELQVTTDKDITVTSILKDKENIPQRIVIKKGDTEYFFKAKDYNDPQIQKFLEENGREYTYMSNGIIRDIKLEIFVPKNMATKITAKYGLIEVKGFSAPLTIDAKYGGVDATISPASTGMLTARSRYGEILTNLDVKFDQQKFPEKQFRDQDKWTEISAKLGTGPSYMIESKYGTVYLRKPN
jgi:hypothetical protein